ncbi:MAG: FmdE family protein [Planctomycetaceae bacterium]|jgi:formylmethanofuran dehydrogenase subunit E|nr:FmdE family protein [Planctomycetaceae bacterium]
MLTQKQIDDVVAFHGHHCPGLTFGMRIGDWVFREFGRAEDEEIVAVVETDMCSVDAIQFLTGCTFGKGNFIFLDYGKNAYSFFRRSDGKNVRLVTRGGLLYHLREEQNQLAKDDFEERKKIRQKMIEKILSADFEEIFAISPAQIPMPETAKIHTSIRCEQCGEMAMSTRIETVNGKLFCIPCRKKIEISS